MDFISFRCTSCNQGLKIGADKAGRRIKCTKCGTILTIPSSGLEEAKPAGASRAAGDAMRVAPEAPPKKMEEEEDDKMGYGILTPAAPEDKLEDKPEEDKKKAPPLKRKLKTLPDLDLWEKVKTGLGVMMIGVSIWGGVVLFMGLMVIFGIMNGPEYAEVLEQSMTAKTTTPAGEVAAPDMPNFMLGLVTGMSYQGIGKVFYILAAVLALFQIVIVMAGCGVCLKIPDRYGSQGQLKALLAFGTLNFFIILIFKLLPALGVINYFLGPYALPEVSLVDANIDRDPPIWVFWSGAPFWEMILTVILLCSFYAQPVLIGIFIWSIGMALREGPVIEKGQGVVILAFGIAFGLLSFHLLSMTGTSGVALAVLRVMYGVWTGFTILLLIRLPAALQATRAILQKYLDGAEMKDEDDEEEDKPRRKRKAKRARDEDDDDD
jgi:ribosomal protein S27E